MDPVKTGALIALVRKEKELTQKNLAEQLHVSTQAVSKWERGLSCPDIGLLEPLAEVLELTVTELLSGQRGEEPGEELVRDSLRFGQNQLGPKIRQWKWLFLLAVVLLAAVLARVGYLWIRDNTEWLPQRETVVRELEASDQERQIANALNHSSFSLRLYELTLADDLKECTIQAELWTHDGLEQTWSLMESSSDDRALFGPRRQLLVLSVEPHIEEWSEEEHRWTEIWFDCGLSFASCVTQRTIDSISNPYISGGVAWAPMNGSRAVDREEGTVLLVLAIGGPNGGTFPPSGPPPVHEEDVELVIRIYCK